MKHSSVLLLVVFFRFSLQSSTTVQTTFNCIFTKETEYALNRTKTQDCKDQIKHFACEHAQNKVFPPELPNYCPQEELRYLGCYKDSPFSRVLGLDLLKFPLTNSLELCRNNCFMLGYRIAGVEYGNECHCGNNINKTAKKAADVECEFYKCPGNGENRCGGFGRISLYTTGIAENSRVKLTIPTGNIRKLNYVRIVFLLTVSGRYSRQIVRLIKNIYRPNHFYYIHVDKRSDYLYEELRKLENLTNNIRLKRNRLATIWGGTSYLDMLLESIEDIFELHSDWQWDFVSTLSESDFPLFQIEDLENFLSLNRKWNFATRCTDDRRDYIKRMAINWAFSECDNHLWKIAEREIPKNIQIEGKSNWFTLNREFLHYVTYSDDPLVKGLKLFFHHTVISGESFFQSLLVNSRFCDRLAPTDLKLVSWVGDKRGCNCDYNVIDWCACSPIATTTSWVDNLNYDNLLNNNNYFVRKFDPTIDQMANDIVEENLNKTVCLLNTMKNQNFWFNDYHHLYDDIRDKPAKLTLLQQGLLPLALKNLNSTHTEAISGKVLELHILLQRKRIFILLKFSTESVSATDLIFETKFEYINDVEIVKHDSRVGYSEVGSDFDSKEYIFRNYANAFGNESKMGVRIESKITSETNVTAIWLDPTDQVQGMFSDRTSMKALPGMTILHFKPNSNMNLISGIWTVQLFVEDTLVRKIRFPLLPQSHYTKSEEFDVATVSEMVSSFYAIRDSCIVSDILTELDDTFVSCKYTNWSSESPDPKSTF